jgi:hypothetical protein
MLLKKDQSTAGCLGVCVFELTRIEDLAGFYTSWLLRLTLRGDETTKQACSGVDGRRKLSEQKIRGCQLYQGCAASIQAQSQQFQRNDACILIPLWAKSPVS